MENANGDSQYRRAPLARVSELVRFGVRAAERFMLQNDTASKLPINPENASGHSVASKCNFSKNACAFDVSVCALSWVAHGDAMR